MHYHRGNAEHTRAALLLAADVSQATDEATHGRRLAATARCLLHVDAEAALPRALLAEAEALAHAHALSFTELEWGRALLLRWDGDLAGARAALERALTLAGAQGERWRELECLICLLLVSERCSTDRATRSAPWRSAWARPMHIAAALRALARMAAHEPGATAAFTAALERLRTVDSKAHLAYALNWAAEIQREQGSRAEALFRAREGCAAQAVDRRMEILVACALLGRLRRRRGFDDTHCRARRSRAGRGAVATAGRRGVGPGTAQCPRPRPPWRPPWRPSSRPSSRSERRPPA
ncbi:MAG: hypothetical protein U1F49_06835 [Rubrivivax sp.]